MTARLLLLCLVFMLAALLGAPAATADSSSGTLVVYVSDAASALPLSGAIVSVQTWFGTTVASGLTDARGAYSVTLSRNLYRVVVTDSGYQRASTWALVKGGGQTTRVDVRLQPVALAPSPTPTWTPTPAPAPPTPTPIPTVTPPASAPTGAITFASQGTTYDILTVNADGSGVLDLTPNTPGSSEHDSAWSPDRSRVVFASDISGVNYLYVVNADGTGLRQLTFGFGSDIQPAWSPDGTQIAFASRRSDLWFEIHVMNADGTNIRALTSLATIQQNPAWSPDSRRLAFQCGSALCVMNADGSGLQTWFSSSINAGKPDWSPDGRRIAFAFDGWIWLRMVDGSTATRLIDGTDPAWSPDGTQLVFVRADPLGGYQHLWRINSDGSGLVQLTSGVSNDIHPDW